MRAIAPVSASMLQASQLTTTSVRMYGGGYRDEFDEDIQRAGKYTKNTRGIKVLTHEEIPDAASFSDLSAKQQSKLQQNGIDELFPVQSCVYKLFTEGKELVVKSRTGTGKTLAFLLPLEELINR